MYLNALELNKSDLLILQTETCIQQQLYVNLDTPFTLTFISYVEEIYRKGG